MRSEVQEGGISRKGQVPRCDGSRGRKMKRTDVHTFDRGREYTSQSGTWVMGCVHGKREIGRATEE